MQLLKVSDNHRYLTTSDGERFYLIGDTAWEMVHRLTKEEVDLYLRTRAEQGFNMVQTVVLAEFGGLTLPNPYGKLPLLKNEQGNFDPTLPDLSGEYTYFDHLEYVLSRAEEYGLYVGLLPTWGDKFNRIWGEGPEIFTPDNAYVYGKWLAQRVVHHTNLIWILGGDRPLTSDIHHAIIRKMAEGIKAGENGKFLMTLHPCGAHSSSEFVHNAPFIDFNMMQSGHGLPTPPCYELAAKDYELSPIKPFMDGEQCYEDHPKNFVEGNDFFDSFDVRLAAWRNLFSGACGNTYGHSCVWGMKKENETSVYWPSSWKTALHRPAADSMYIYRDFILSHDLTSMRPIYNAIENNTHDMRYVAAMVNEKEAYLYLPIGAPVKINIEALPFTPKAYRLYNPRNGQYTELSKFPEDLCLFFDLGGGRNCDLVLLLFA